MRKLSRYSRVGSSSAACGLALLLGRRLVGISGTNEIKSSAEGKLRRISGDQRPSTLVPKVGTSCRVLVPMRQKVVPRANREAIAGFIRPPLQLGLVKPGTDFRHEVLVGGGETRHVLKARGTSEAFLTTSTLCGRVNMPRTFFKLIVALSVLPLSGCTEDSCGTRQGANPWAMTLDEGGNDKGVTPAKQSGSRQSKTNVSPGSNIDIASETRASVLKVPVFDSSSLPLEIEEGDLVQLEEKKLYVHNEIKGLTVLDVSDVTQPKILGQIAEVAGNAGELYVRGKHAIVVVEQDAETCEFTSGAGAWSVNERHKIASLDTVHTFSLLDSECLPGKVVGSRLVAERLYVLSENSGFGAAASWLTVFDISNPQEIIVLDVESFAGTAHEFYVSNQAVYVAERVFAGTEVAVQGAGRAGMGGAPSWAPTEAPKEVPPPNAPAESLGTNLRYYEIGSVDDPLIARGSLPIFGAPQGRFHFDEAGDTFRLVTFLGRAEGSAVTVVDISNPDKLRVEGALLALAPREDLHAARFVGDSLYVVTYEAVILRTDPLWIIDLSDPQAPTVQGSLEIPGFSSFLYPRGDTLLAVGRGDQGARVAVSLFDVSNPAAPAEIQRLELGADTALTEGNLDYRGLSILEVGTSNPLLAVPLTVQTLNGDSCTQENSMAFIEWGQGSLTLRSEVSLTDRARRTLAIDNHVVSVGDVNITTFDVSNLGAPLVRSTITVGDRDAPLECIEFDEVLGNSPDARANPIPRQGWGNGEGEDLSDRVSHSGQKPEAEESSAADAWEDCEY